MNKYTHSKPSSFLKVKTRRSGKAHIPYKLSSIEKRKEENQKTLERIFGFNWPIFGSTLGVTFDSQNGITSKTYRAESVA